MIGYRILTGNGWQFVNEIPPKYSGRFFEIEHADESEPVFTDAADADTTA